MATAAPAPSTEALWAALSADLRRYLLRRVDRPDLAEDLLQETFVRIHARLGDLADAARVRGWVYQIARSALADHFRRTRPTEDLPEGLEADAPEEADLGPVVGGWLRDMIADLPAPYRDALERVEIAGISQRTLADELGISVSGAKSRVQRGRALLRERFERCCQLELDRGGRVVEVRPQRPSCCDPQP